tara:strand:+ start:162 stop:836 length:675 start_codon:yes stop_codon:yes gene_type:complete
MNRNKIIMKKILKENVKIHLGNRSGRNYKEDPKRLVFSISRYKFVSKMFQNYENVLEVGAGDGFKSAIVKQSCKNLLLSDIDINNQIDFLSNKFFNSNYIIHDFTKSHLSQKQKFDGIYLLDVLEHINKQKEKKFLKNILSSLKKYGTLIVGMPSIESQKYASRLSKIGHINCKNKSELQKLLLKYFNVCYMFSMNDEVLHTGKDEMSNYVIAVANSKKSKNIK